MLQTVNVVKMIAKSFHKSYQYQKSHWFQYFNDILNSDLEELSSWANAFLKKL